MPVIERIDSYGEDLRRWRRHIHAWPELGLDCQDTATFVAERLREFGISEIHEGIATSGIVAVIEGTRAGPTIGLRADMDALPMQEETDLDYASRVPGRMHACGHDGHTAMLLGAARYLNETRNFAGRAALIFQPAEEYGDGGRVMCEEGIMDRFAVREVYALHTSSSFDVGTFALRPGPIMAGVDEFEIRINGRGGHGGFPHLATDPIAAGLQLGNALQTIVARNTNAFDNVVVSITQFHAGTTHNVIPEEAMLGGTIRTYKPEARDMVRRRMGEICEGIGAAMGVAVSFDYLNGLPPTVNHPEQTAFAERVAKDIVGEDRVITDMDPRMSAEDFSYMLQHRPGVFVFIGQGDGPFLHNPGFDFNDEVAPLGASYFARLVERALPLD